MPIIQRTTKLVIATLCAIWLAEQIGLAYASSAGIIAMLSLLDTRKSTLQVGIKRLLSTLLALNIACLVIRLFGFELGIFGLYLAIYVPLAYRFSWQIGITPSSVLVSHLFLEHSISPPLLLNELVLFIIGTSFAFLVNLYMPAKDAEIQRYHSLVEGELRMILTKFQNMLETHDGKNEAQLITHLDHTLEQALKLVYHDRANRLFHQTDYHIHYFEMRQQQNNLLREMATDISQCTLDAQESQILAELFEKTARQISRENPATDLLDTISHYLTIFRERPLPQSRNEFETRATLLQLLHDLERMIQLKVTFHQKYPDI